ncbi:MAG: Rrf2 family transcriptional regulator [Oscillospiraceae bacterium]|nr:Rrf2 family transcriptional regulator [Oscillospiraceae bacterium]
MHISNKCSIAVHCLICIHEFGKESRVTSEMLAMSSGINPVTIRGIMSALKKDNVISVKSGVGGAVLCCPTEEITLYRICSAVEPDFLEKLFGIHSSPSQLCPVGKNISAVLKPSYNEVAEALTKSLKSITMAEIIDNYKNISNREN